MLSRAAKLSLFSPLVGPTVQNADNPKGSLKLIGLFAATGRADAGSSYRYAKTLMSSLFSCCPAGSGGRECGPKNRMRVLGLEREFSGCLKEKRRLGFQEEERKSPETERLGSCTGRALAGQQTPSSPRTNTTARQSHVGLRRCVSDGVAGFTASIIANSPATRRWPGSRTATKEKIRIYEVTPSSSSATSSCSSRAWTSAGEAAFEVEVGAAAGPGRSAGCVAR